MKIILTPELSREQDVLVLGLFENEKSKFAFPQLQKEIDAAIGRKLFEKKFGSTYSTCLEGKPVLVIALGEEKEMTLDKVRRALGKAVSFTRSKAFDSLATDIVFKVRTKFPEAALGRAATEGLLLSEYFFSKYLSQEQKEKKKELKQAAIQFTGKGFEEGMKTGRVIAEATNWAKEMVNEPALVVNSVYLEQAARKIAKGPVKLHVMEKEEMKKEGLNALLGVASGGVNPPKLIFLEYKGNPGGKWTALVGKGITFDSGGYNLKPTHYIEDMKCDMAGGAAVLGTIKAMSELKVKKNILGVIPVCDNLVSGTAQKPGDVVKAYNGKTIEINNTDAEGRLILADALSYTEAKYHPKIIVDIATLTGAAIVALGYYVSAMVGKDEELQKELKKAGEESYDRVWQLPFYEEYQGLMEGDISELSNVSKKGKGFEAGTITGGVFLSKFVEKARWAHIDIGGTAFVIEDGDYLQKGATGAGVRLFSYWLMR